MAKFFSVVSNRVCKCKICEKDITIGEKHFMLNNIHVSPRHVDLHFHDGCLYESYENAKEERSLNKRKLE